MTNTSTPAAPSAQQAAGSIDTPEFRRVLENWASQSRLVYAPESFAALVAHIHAWAAATPAQPIAAPKIETVTLTGNQLRAALDFINPDGPSDELQCDDELTFGIVDHKDDSGEVSRGMCCWNGDTDGVFPLSDVYVAPAQPIAVSAPTDERAASGMVVKATFGEHHIIVPIGNANDLPIGTKLYVAARAAAPVSGQGAMEVLQDLVSAVEFTPLGVRGIVAVSAAKKVLDSRPRSEDSRYREGVQRGAEMTAATFSPMLKASSEDSRAEVLEEARAACVELATGAHSRDDLISRLRKQVDDANGKLFDAEQRLAGRSQTEDGGLSAAKAAMERAKKLPIWDNMHHPLHVELDVIFKYLDASTFTPKEPAAQGGVPEGWTIERKEGRERLTVQKDGLGYAPHPDDESIASVVLWHLANDILAAAPGASK